MATYLIQNLILIMQLNTIGVDGASVERTKVGYSRPIGNALKAKDMIAAVWRSN